MAPVSLTCCESTLPLTLSLSDSGNYFYPLAPAPRAEYEFLFTAFSFYRFFFLPVFLFTAPATNGRQAIALPS